MARLSTTPYPWKWRGPEYDFPTITSFEEVLKQEQEALDALIRKSASLPPGQVVGAVLSWPVADGSAYYLVTKDKPLTLQHIPCGDAWKVDPILIRGLRRDDVTRMLEAEKRFQEIFARAERGKRVVDP